MGLGSAEPQHVDVLTGHGAHHVGAGHEDPALGPEDHHVGERRAVRRAAGRRTEHDRDLRDLARGLGHHLEDPAHRVQRQHTLGEPGAAGVPEPDDRHPVGHRAVVGVDDHAAADVAHRATHHGRVGAERHDVRPADLADGSEHAGVVIGRDQLQRALVEERGEPVDRVARVLLAGQLDRLGGRGRCGHSGRCPSGWLIRSRRRRRRWRHRSRRSC